MEERYQFLSRQKSDLDEAIKSIKDIIDEIDKKTADSFLKRIIQLEYILRYI